MNDFELNFFFFFLDKREVTAFIYLSIRLKGFKNWNGNDWSCNLPIYVYIYVPDGTNQWSVICDYQMGKPEKKVGTIQPLNELTNRKMR